MKLQSLYKNITIKQANIITMIVIFAFSLLFVLLLVEEMYKDYEKDLQKNIISYQIHSVNSIISQKELEKEKKLKLKSLLIKTILAIVTLSFIIFAIALGFYKILSALLERDINTFLNFFESAAHQEQVLIPNAILFKDFRIMVGYVNRMLDIINEKKQSLEELNMNLEERVRQKTADVIEEKNFSQELLKSQKEFLRYTVHETNTPLSVILTSIELYEMNNPKNRQLSKIEAAVKNIFSIYDDLSYLVKKNQVEYPKTVINLEKYIGSRIDFFKEVAQQSRIIFEYIPTAIDAHTYFNETKLQRVVDNTITNAIKYTLVNQKVTVRLEKSGSLVSFSVGSKSKAIQNPNKVFEAYYRENNVAKDSKGFGLGLQLVRKICEEENIAVLVESDEKYTTFTYKFKMMGQ